MKYLAALILLGVAACGYRAPPATDTASPAYLGARDSCAQSATATVDKTNAKTGLAWLSSPVLRWRQIGDATGSCMDDKGYGRVRWCTSDELRSGNRQNGMIVTASGVQCSDPPTHRADTAPPVAAPKAKAGTHSP